MADGELLTFLLGNVWDTGPISISDPPQTLPDWQPALIERVLIAPLSLAGEL